MYSASKCKHKPEFHNEEYSENNIFLLEVNDVVCGYPTYGLVFNITPRMTLDRFEFKTVIECYHFRHSSSSYSNTNNLKTLRQSRLS